MTMLRVSPHASLILLVLAAVCESLGDWRAPNGNLLEEGHIGLIQHDKTRRLEDWEDHNLPIPQQIHLLGHHSKDRDAKGRTKSVWGLRKGKRKTAYGEMTSESDGLITPLYQGY